MWKLQRKKLQNFSKMLRNDCPAVTKILKLSQNSTYLAASGLNPKHQVFN